MVVTFGELTIMLSEGLGDLARDVLADALTKGVVVVEDVGCERVAIAPAVALCTLKATMGCIMVNVLENQRHGNNNLQLTGSLNSTLAPLIGSALDLRLEVGTVFGLGTVSMISKSPVLAGNVSV